MNRKITRGVIAAIAAVTLTSAGVAAPAAFANDRIDDGVSVSSTETVQVLMDAAGKVDAQRVYEQLVLRGNGKVDIANPVSTKGLRNLDGFGGFEIQDGKQRITTEVDGTKKFRTVSDYTKALPIDIDITYTLDGKKVRPGDIVGKSGDLEVRYVVTNKTGKSEDVTYEDGNGAAKIANEKVVVPMVGSLTTVLPSTFTKVRSDEANAAGDGRGGTQLSFTMTLIPPIGSDTAEFGYSARVSDGVVPKASVSVLPVNPLESPSFKGGAASYKGGAETGQDLTAGATEIDANVLKLRDGANDLVTGILQLAEGANQLNAGTGELSAGAGKLDKGAGDLQEGLDTAGAKSPQLAEGLATINKGLAAVDSNLSKLVTDAVGPAVGGIGDSGTPGKTVSYGVKAIRDGLAAAKVQLDAGLDDAPASVQSLNCAAAVIADIAGGPNAPGACFGGTRPATLTKDADPTRKVVLGNVATGLSTGASELEALTAQLNTLSAGLGDAVNNLYGVSCGVDSTSAPVCDPAKPGVLQALLGIKTGVGTSGDKPTESLRGGVKALKDGSQDAREGALALVDGLTQLDDGAGQLSDGTGELRSGADKLDAGSGKLAEGLNTAAEGAPELPEGASRLSKEGTSVLVDKGNATAMDYGLKYALLEAGAARAGSAQPYGSPEGAMELTAYKFEIAGENGAGSANVKRGLAAIVLLVGAAAFASARRRGLI